MNEVNTTTKKSLDNTLLLEIWKQQSQQVYKQTDFLAGLAVFINTSLCAFNYHYSSYAAFSVFIYGPAMFVIALLIGTIVYSNKNLGRHNSELLKLLRTDNSMDLTIISNLEDSFNCKLFYMHISIYIFTIFYLFVSFLVASSLFDIASWLSIFMIICQFFVLLYIFNALLPNKYVLSDNDNMQNTTAVNK